MEVVVDPDVIVFADPKLTFVVRPSCAGIRVKREGKEGREERGT